MNKQHGDPGKQGYRLLYQTFGGDWPAEEIDANRIDWDALLVVAHLNRLSPLLHCLLKDADRLGMVPAHARANLEESYLRSMEYGMRILEAHSRITESFRRKGISFLDLRGTDWAYSLYGGNPALRPMLDLDLFVTQECFNDAEKVLREVHGYERLPIKPHHNHHEVYRKDLVFVELHRKLFIDPLLAVFPDFVVGGSIDRVRAVRGRPLACLHYWIHTHKPAVRLCDYFRLPETPMFHWSPALRALVAKTEDLLGDASHGSSTPFQDGGYRNFWIRFFGNRLFHIFIRNPLQGLKLSLVLAQWQAIRFSGAARR